MMVTLIAAFVATPLHAAEKLKGFYSGSGGIAGECIAFCWFSLPPTGR